MSTSAPESPAVLEINDADCFVEARLNGVTFTVDLAEIQDMLWEIDRRHSDDPWRCLDCGCSFNPEQSELTHFDEHKALPCPGCESGKTHPPQAFLDDVAKLLTERWNVPRVGRNTAAGFYAFVAAKIASLKKTSLTSPESPDGSAG